MEHSELIPADEGPLIFNPDIPGFARKLIAHEPTLVSPSNSAAFMIRMFFFLFFWVVRLPVPGGIILEGVSFEALKSSWPEVRGDDGWWMEAKHEQHALKQNRLSASTDSMRLVADTESHSTDCLLQTRLMRSPFDDPWVGASVPKCKSLIRSDVAFDSWVFEAYPGLNWLACKTIGSDWGIHWLPVYRLRIHWLRIY